MISGSSRNAKNSGARYILHGAAGKMRTCWRFAVRRFVRCQSYRCVLFAPAFSGRLPNRENSLRSARDSGRQLSPTSRAQRFFISRTWGLRPRLYASARFAGSRLEIEGLAGCERRGVPRTELLIPLRQRVTQELVHLLHPRTIHRLNLREILLLPRRWPKVRIK